MARETVEILEVGLRDGLQMLDYVVPTESKRAWLEAERLSGVKRFEVASFVPAKILPQMADAAELVQTAKASDVYACALVPNLRGAEGAFAAGVDAVLVPASASAAHSVANVRRTREQMIEAVAEIRTLRDSLGISAHVEVGISTAFGCTLQGDVPEADVVWLAAAAVEAGADGVALADTVGYADPALVRSRILAVRAAIGDRLTGAHFHDTRGLGLANVLAALDVGIRSFDASLGGLGGCPFAPGASGNIATEDLVFMLESMGLDTGIDIDRLIEAQQCLASLLPEETLHGKISGAGLPRNFARRAAA